MDQTSRKKLIFVVVFVVLLVAIFALILLFLPRKKTDDKKKPDNKQTTTTISQKNQNGVFAENFVKEFTTYDYRNPADYMVRLTPYISTGYVDNFKKRFRLPASIAPEEKNNYSKYESSKVVTLKEQGGKTTIYVDYFVLKVDAPFKKGESKEQNAVTMVIEKNNEGALKITSLVFSTTD